MDKCIAIIPARGGSKGIKDKNLQKIGDVSLVGRAVQSCISAGFKDVFILSDSDAIRQEGEDFGANGEYIRPSNISHSTSHMFALYKWFFETMLEKVGATPEAFCCVLPTTPFRPVNALVEAKEALLSGNYDWVLSINEQEHHPYRTVIFKENAEDLIEPFVDVSPDVFWANRQELPKMYRFNGGVIGGLVRHVLENDEYNISKQLPTKVKGIEITSEESFDIDTPFELEIARWLHNEK